jgi:hypothetical protein
VTLDILRMDITKDLLRKMAKEERCLFLALGHASNQVNALWKDSTSKDSFSWNSNP